jgi:hypothetical protein
MQVTTPNISQPTLRTLNAPKQDAPQPEGPKDTFGQAVWKETVRTGFSTANKVGDQTAGALAIPGAVAGGWVGFTGGVAAGLAAGVVTGLVSGAVVGSGGGAFVSTALAAGGFTTQAFGLIGAVSGAVGGWTAAGAVGQIPGKIIGGVLGGVAGAGKGAANYYNGVTGASTPEAPQNPEEGPKQSTGEFKGWGRNAAIVVGGVSALGGITGGAIVGAGVMTGAGVMAEGLTWAALEAAKGGAIGGAAIFGVVSAIGGYQLIKAGHNFIINRRHNLQQLEQASQLTVKENALNKQVARLDDLDAKAESKHTAALADIKQRTQELDGRQGVVGEKEGQVALKVANQDKLSADRGEELYKGEKSRLIGQESGLKAEDRRQEGEAKRLETKEAEVPELVRQRASKMLSELEQKLEASYQSRKGQLSERERGLDRREADIPRIVDQKVQAELQPIRDDIDRNRREERKLNAEADSDRREAGDLMARIPGLQAETRSNQNRADSLRREADGLRPEFRSLNSEVTASNQDLERKQGENANLRDQLTQCQNEKK